MDGTSELPTEILHEILSHLSTKIVAQTTLKYSLLGTSDPFWITAIYARSKAAKRVSLWNKLRDINSIIDGPWAIRGDFNSIIASKEKKGGIPFRLSKSIDFITCIEGCGKIDPVFTGNILTWCNGRGRQDRISMRLDKIIFTMMNGP